MAPRLHSPTGRPQPDVPPAPQPWRVAPAQPRPSPSLRACAEGAGRGGIEHGRWPVFDREFTPRNAGRSNDREARSEPRDWRERPPRPLELAGDNR